MCHAYKPRESKLIYAAAFCVGVALALTLLGCDSFSIYVPDPEPLPGATYTGTPMRIDGVPMQPPDWASATNTPTVLQVSQ